MIRPSPTSNCRARRRRVGGAALCLAVAVTLAAACGSSDSAKSGEATPTSSNGSGSDPSSAGDDAELTASFRGVTEDTITLGAVGIDFDLLRELGLVDIDFGDTELVLQTFADELNDRGGILGRKVEIEFRTYSVLSPESALAACVELTEDVEVFAMLNGFNGPAKSTDTCIANDHETVLIGDAGNNEDMISAKAPWIQTALAGNTRLDLAAIDLADGEGLLDGETIAIHSLAAESERVAPIRERLESLGHEVVLETTNDAGQDPALGAENWQVIAERIKEEKITTLIIPGAATFEVGQMIDLGLIDDLQIINSDIAVGGLPTFDNHDDEDFDGIIGTFGPTAAEGEDDPGLAECREIFETATGIEVLPAAELGEDDPNWGVSIALACTRLRLFEMLATAAGPNLTNDTFRAAVEAAGEVDLPGVSKITFGPGKYDGNDSARLGVLDSSLEEVWKPITDLIELPAPSE